MAACEPPPRRVVAAAAIHLDARFAPGIISPPDAVVVVCRVALLHQASESEQARQTDPTPIGVVVLVSPIVSRRLTGRGLIRRRAGWGSSSLAEGGNR